ncbi:hypothetical protein XENOCAPTIV_000971 [Xenoophorus captivus]|uniref:Uncharacterized protein n=1 Tax=Xenoophorus captivus TaxID=1517983 RepID=A0ABV0S4Q3_9TELE
MVMFFMALVMAGLNAQWFGPAATEVMFQMRAVEEEHGLGNQIGLGSQREEYAKLKEQDPKYRAYKKTFGQYHGLSNLCNLIGFIICSTEKLSLYFCSFFTVMCKSRPSRHVGFTTGGFEKWREYQGSSVAVERVNVCSRAHIHAPRGQPPVLSSLAPPAARGLIPGNSLFSQSVLCMPISVFRNRSVDLDSEKHIFCFSICTLMASSDSRLHQPPSQKDAADQNFDYMFKLLIIGNSSVGKTSFLFRYADDSFTSAFVSTVGIDFKVKTVFRNDKRIKLQIWVSG